MDFQPCLCIKWPFRNWSCQSKSTFSSFQMVDSSERVGEGGSEAGDFVVLVVNLFLEIRNPIPKSLVLVLDHVIWKLNEKSIRQCFTNNYLFRLEGWVHYIKVSMVKIDYLWNLRPNVIWKSRKNQLEKNLLKNCRRLVYLGSYDNEVLY